MVKKGNRYGTHRVLEPKFTFPQPALRPDNDFSEIYDNEVLCNVSTLNIDAASFVDIRDRAGDDPQEIARIGDG